MELYQRDCEASLGEVSTSDQRKRRQAFSTNIQARSWFEDKEYPLATQLALDALFQIKEIQSWTKLTHIEALYQDLLETNYKDAPAVAELGVELLKVQHPKLFS